MYLDNGQEGTLLGNIAGAPVDVRVLRSDAQTADPLLEAARAGRPDAFETLVTMYDAKVLGLATRLLQNAEDARDAAQETFIRLYRYRHRIDPTRDLLPWLCRLTVNVCRDWMRRRRRQLTTPLAGAEADRLAAPDCTDAGARLAEAQAWLETALATLSPREREALVLRDIEGLDTRDVAKALGSTQMTVRSQISRARCKLKAFRAAHFGDEI